MTDLKFPSRSTWVEQGRHTMRDAKLQQPQGSHQEMMTYVGIPIQQRSPRHARAIEEDLGVFHAVRTC